MGCCHSTTTAESPARPPVARSERSAINPPPRLSRSPRNVSNQQPPWTRAHLEQQREIFFETQTSGDPNVWVTLRSVAEHIRRGEMKDAQAIFDAAGLSCPDGSFVKGKRRVDPVTGAAIPNGGVYDPRGRRYAIPLWCVADPEDLIEEQHERGAGNAERMHPAGPVVDSSDEDASGAENEGSAPKSASREVKGKEREEDIGEALRVRARLTTTAEDFYFTLGSKQPIQILVERIRSQLSMPRERLRLMFKGRELRNDQTLEAQGWAEGDTLSVFVTPGNNS